MGSKTKQETTIPPPTEEERALMQLTVDSIMPAYLEQAGFRVSKQTVGWEDSPDGQRIINKRQQLESQLSQAKDQNQINQIQNQLGQLSQQEQSSRSGYTPKTQFVTEKKAGDYAEAIREKYGKDSQQFKDAIAKEQEDKIAMGAASADIQKKTMERAQKFLNGDFSITESDKQFIKDVAAPIRESFDAAAKYVTDEAATSKTNIGDAITKFSEQVKQTGLDMGSAVGMLADRVKETGQNMKQALDEEIGITKQLVSMGLEDFTREQRMNISSQAASLGRSPTDPNFQLELQGMVNREIQRTGLELGRYSAEKKLGIEERTGAGLEEAERLRLGIAERTGAGQEQAAQQRVGLEERTAGLREGAAQLRGQGEVQAGQVGSQLRQQLGMGILPEQIGAGIDFQSYQSALAQQRMANIGAAMNAPLSIYGVQAEERYRQPTTTTSKSGGIGATIGGIIKTGLGVAGTFFGGPAGGAIGSKIGGVAGGTLGRDF